MCKCYHAINQNYFRANAITVKSTKELGDIDGDGKNETQYTYQNSNYVKSPPAQSGCYKFCKDYPTHPTHKAIKFTSLDGNEYPHNSALLKQMKRTSNGVLFKRGEKVMFKEKTYTIISFSMNHFEPQQRRAKLQATEGDSKVTFESLEDLTKK